MICEQRPTLSRRDFLRSSGAAGLVLGFACLPACRALTASPVDGPAPPVHAPFTPNAFIRVAPDNTVTIVCKHLEMGQGNTTGLATLAADELDADWSLVRTEYAPSDPKVYNNVFYGEMQITGGSTSIANSFMQMRSAGATARAMLVAAAANAWHVPAAEINTANSVLTHASGRRATYGEMAAAAGRLPVPKDVALKQPQHFTLIGKQNATPRVDSLSKCNGSAIYTIDVTLPGLLTAVIAFPPSFGAKVISFDSAEAMRVPGVADVVQVPEGVAVVGTGTWAVLKGRRALKVAWDESTGASLNSDAVLAQYRAQAQQPGVPFAQPADERLDMGVFVAAVPGQVINRRIGGAAEHRAARGQPARSRAQDPHHHRRTAGEPRYRRRSRQLARAAVLHRQARGRRLHV